MKRSMILVTGALIGTLLSSGGARGATLAEIRAAPTNTFPVTTSGVGLREMCEAAAEEGRLTGGLVTALDCAKANWQHAHQSTTWREFVKWSETNIHVGDDLQLPIVVAAAEEPVPAATRTEPVVVRHEPDPATRNEVAELRERVDHHDQVVADHDAMLDGIIASQKLDQAGITGLRDEMAALRAENQELRAANGALERTLAEHDQNAARVAESLGARVAAIELKQSAAEAEAANATHWPMTETPSEPPIGVVAVEGARRFGGQLLVDLRKHGPGMAGATWQYATAFFWGVIDLWNNVTSPHPSWTILILGILLISLLFHIFKRRPETPIFEGAPA